MLKIVFDMDNTIVDELGSSIREDLVNFIKELKKEHRLILWTNSTRNRAIELLNYHHIYHLFDSFIYRENYDPDNKGIQKSINNIDADLLVDDDPDEIKYNKEKNNNCFLIKSFRKGTISDSSEIYSLKKTIKRIALKKKVSSIFTFLKR